MASLLHRPSYTPARYGLREAALWSAGLSLAAGTGWWILDGSIATAIGEALRWFSTSGLPLGLLAFIARFVEVSEIVEQEHRVIEETPEDMEPIPGGAKWREQATRQFASTAKWYKVGQHPEADPFDLRLWELARNYQIRQSLSPRKWPAGKPFTTGEFANLLEELKRRKWITRDNPGSLRSGYVFTHAGAAVMRHYLGMLPPLPQRGLRDD